ncbi:kinase-like domain-containing protein [Rhizophagus diaphanus]|nr:kinase-like domain-containing protein [Rhizophagus diaphanus] [Rhizophagus sp. MUCL 43196]
MSNNIEIKVTENSDERINWIENAISKNYFKYYEYNHFRNIKEIGFGNFKKFIVQTGKLKRQYEMDFHENIMRFCGITIIKNQDDDSKNYLLVMEYADNGTLRNYLKEHFDSLNWDNKLNIALKLARAVSYLHEKEIVHLNLVILYLKKSLKQCISSSRDYQINRFWIIKRIEESSNLQSNFFDMSNIYSIGVFLCEISSGQSPFYNEPSDTCLDLKILQGLREKPVANTPIDYAKIYIDCWNHEPDNRPIISEVIAKLNVIILNKLSIVDDLVALIDKLNLEEEAGKEEVLDYLNDHDITPQQIYNWLLYNQTNLNSVILLGDFFNFGIEVNVDKEKAFGAGTYVDKQKAFELYQKVGDFDK